MRHARYSGVTDVTAVEEGKHIYRDTRCEKEGYITVGAFLLTEDKEERHQVSIKLATHASLSALIVLEWTVQLSGRLVVNMFWVELGHV